MSEHFETKLCINNLPVHSSVVLAIAINQSPVDDVDLQLIKATTTTTNHN